MNTLRTALAACLATVTLAAFAEAPKIVDEFSGEVLAVTAGDVLRIQDGERSYFVTVRLEGIYAPEKGTPYADKAKETLANETIGKKALVKVTGADRSKRSFAMISINGRDINALMLERGLAWHDSRYSTDERLAKLEADARRNKRGMWAEGERAPPWSDDAPREASSSSSSSEIQKAKYWLNSKSGVRHNSTCEHFGNTNTGRACSKSEGKACGKCGG